MKNIKKQIKLKTDKFGQPIPLLVPKPPVNQEPRRSWCILNGVLMTREDALAYDRN